MQNSCFLMPDHLYKQKIRTRNPLGLGSDYSCLVRETGLEPVQCELHAPQTCASASSATPAGDMTEVPVNIEHYTTVLRFCQ